MRFRKVDRELLSFIDGMVTDGELELDSKHAKQWSSFIERVAADELKKGARAEGGGYISASKAVDVLKSVLGSRAVVPAAFPRVSKQWFIQMQNRINTSGLTADLLTRAAEAAKVVWRGPIKVESVIRQADVLLSEASSTPSLPERGDDLQEL